MVDALLDAFLADAVASRGDPAAVNALTDYLSDLPPAPVDYHRIHEWLRRVLAIEYNDRLNSREHRLAKSRRRRLSTGEARDELDVFAAIVTGQTGHYLHMDHWGNCVVGGHPCVANQPYATLEATRAHARALMDWLGFVVVGLPTSHYGHGTTCVLIFPRGWSTKGMKNA